MNKNQLATSWKIYILEKVFKLITICHTDKFCRNLMLNFLKKMKNYKNNYNLISIIFLAILFQLY